MNALQSIVGILGALLLAALVAAAGSAAGATVAGVPVFMLCAVLTMLIQWAVFLPSYFAQTESYFDVTGSLCYVGMVVFTLLATEPDPRSLLVGGLVLVWAVRLGSFLFTRIRADGGDRRFRTIKTDFLRFLMTWTLQGTWVLVTFAAGLAAMTASERAPLGWLAGLGTLLWLGGFIIEVAADQQKRAFRADAGRETEFITSGLWAWSRHPNYFGEIMLWCGIALIALPVLQGWQWLTLISPVFVTVLLTRISGIPMLERRADRQWGEDPLYRAYKAATPALIPRPPAGP